MKIRVKQGETYTSPLTPLQQLERGIAFSPSPLGGEGRGEVSDSAVTFELEANSHLELTQITFAEQDLSQSFEVIFLGEGASCDLYFLDLAKNSSHLETIVKVFHKVPNCKSTQLHKGLYTDESVGSLKAFVEVAPHALGTDASQLHRSLLLSPKACSKPEPHLKIQADAVKCKHGVSIGQLDDKALFYLMARGLDEKTAKGLLIQAFAQEILDTVSEKYEISKWI